MNTVPMILKAAAIEPGDLLHVRSHGKVFKVVPVGKLIRRVLDSWGNHDAVLDFDDETGELIIKESHPPRSGETPWYVYDEGMRSGLYECRVYRPMCDANIRALACRIWEKDVHNLDYDSLAFVRLLIKAQLMDIWPKAAGLEWSWYCTEGVNHSYKKAGFDIYNKNNATPGTTERRVGVTLEDITARVLIPA